MINDVASRIVANAWNPGIRWSPDTCRLSRTSRRKPNLQRLTARVTPFDEHKVSIRHDAASDSERCNLSRAGDFVVSPAWRHIGRAELFFFISYVFWRWRSMSRLYVIYMLRGVFRDHESLFLRSLSSGCRRIYKRGKIFGAVEIFRSSRSAFFIRFLNSCVCESFSLSDLWNLIFFNVAKLSTQLDSYANILIHVNVYCKNYCLHVDTRYQSKDLGMQYTMYLIFQKTYILFIYRCVVSQFLSGQIAQDSVATVLKIASDSRAGK